jgi:YHS domain-containing protein
MGWLLRLFLIALLLSLVLRSIYRFLEGVVDGATGSRARADRSRPQVGHMVKDPVCGTYVVQGRALTAARGHETAWFCSPQCQRRWLQGKA